MKKKLLKSLSILAIVAIFIIGGTMSYFSDTETSTGNKFTAGKLNLKIDSTCRYNDKECVYNENLQKYFWTGTEEECFCSWEEKDMNGELFFNLNDVKPGDTGEDTISLHVINNDSWMCAQIANLKNFDNNCEQPEIQIDTTCGNPGEGEGELQNYLKLTLWKDNGAGNLACNNILDTGEEIFVNNQPISSTLWPLADSTTGNGPFIGDETYCVGASWNVPIATGNIIQTDSVTADIRFVAVQARNMENFKCSELFAEVCDGIDNDYNGIVDDNWTTLGQTCSVGTGACAAEGVYTCDSNNTAGPVVCSATAGTAGEEICDGLDNDCDGEVDEDVKTTFYQDTDSDGYGDISTINQACVMPAGYVANNTDCDDFNATVHPGAVEIPGDGIDQDCSETDAISCFRDQDRDGYGLATTIVIAADGSCDTNQSESSNSNDCYDNSASISPVGIEVPGNNTDENCSGTVACYIDADNDNYGSSGIVQDGYPAVNGTATTFCGVNNTDGLDDTSNDCNDANSAIKPSAMESCNNIDDNCNNMIDEGLSMRNYYKDYDNDTYANPNDFLYRCGPTGDYDMTWIGQVDCNDNNSSVHPGAQDYCNGVDEDCDSQIDDNFPEQWTECRSCSGPFGGWDPYWTCVSGSLVCPPC